MPVMVGKAHIGHKYYTLEWCNGSIDGFMYNEFSLLYCKSMTKVSKLQICIGFFPRVELKSITKV